jgi:glycoside/pentoside/hexuronide:cation symporter, GPH family
VAAAAARAEISRGQGFSFPAGERLGYPAASDAAPVFPIPIPSQAAESGGGSLDLTKNSPFAGRFPTVLRGPPPAAPAPEPPDPPMDVTAAPAVPPAETAPEDRVPVSQKVGYGLGSFIDMWGHWHYPNFAGLVFNIFLGVNPFLVGAAVVLNRVFDAVSDPLFGWLSDNTRSRFGRRRPYMLIGSVVAGLGLPLVVAVRPGWGSTHIFGHNVSNYFWFMLASSAVYLPLVSCFNMPYQSLGFELTPDYQERTSVFSYKNFVQKIPEAGLFFGGQFLTMAAWVGAKPGNILSRVRLLFGGQLFASGSWAGVDRAHFWARLKVLLAATGRAWGPSPADAKPNILLGSQVFCVLCGCIMMLAGLACFFLVRERYYGKVVAGKQSKISIRETLWQTLMCQPFRVTVLMNLAYSLGLSMVGTLGFYDTVYYVCRGDVSVGARWNFLMGIAGMVLGASGVPVFAFLAKILGKRLGMATVFSSAIIIFLGSWWLYNPSAPALQVFASGFIAFIGAGFWTIWGSMVADVVDYDELENGRRREGSFAACNSWITKVGMAVGAGTSFGILGWVGFEAGLGGHQAAHTLFMIRFLFAVIPVVGLTLALISLVRFPLSKERMADIRRQLEGRRGMV